MAERRMFAKTIIDSDAFLDMPVSARLLYYDLGMRADDEGFVNSPRKIMRVSGATNDDMNVLISRQFVIPFDSGIVVIKHWRIHNYIRGDRKHQTTFVEELSQLDTTKNGEYFIKQNEQIPEEKPQPVLEISSKDETEGTTKDETARQKAYKNSSLPYSFDYKIRHAFYGEPCPVCGALMQRDNIDGIITDNRIPTIQHNIPISKGGVHELGNISVICKQCNITIKDNETGDLNADEVINVWDQICQSNVSQMSGICQTHVSIGKDSIGKDSIDNTNTPLTPLGEDKKSLDKPKKDYSYNKHTNLENACYILNYLDYKEKAWLLEHKNAWECIKTWLKYTDERKDKYKGETSLTRLFSMFVNNIKEYGLDAVSQVVDESIASNYQGVTWDKLKRYPKVAYNPVPWSEHQSKEFIIPDEQPKEEIDYEYQKNFEGE